MGRLPNKILKRRPVTLAEEVEGLQNFVSGPLAGVQPRSFLLVQSQKLGGTVPSSRPSADSRYGHSGPPGRSVIGIRQPQIGIPAPLVIVIDGVVVPALRDHEAVAIEMTGPSRDAPLRGTDYIQVMPAMPARQFDLADHLTDRQDVLLMRLRIEQKLVANPTRKNCGRSGVIH